MIGKHTKIQGRGARPPDPPLYFLMFSYYFPILSYENLENQLKKIHILNKKIDSFRFEPRVNDY